jgi:hypothetical protein
MFCAPPPEPRQARGAIAAAQWQSEIERSATLGFMAECGFRATGCRVDETLRPPRCTDEADLNYSLLSVN